MEKYKTGAQLTVAEHRQLDTHLLALAVAELEHICDALRNRDSSQKGW